MIILLFTWPPSAPPCRPRGSLTVPWLSLTCNLASPVTCPLCASFPWLHLLLVTFPDLLSLALLPHGIDLSQLWPSPGLLSTECPESPLVSCHLLMTLDLAAGCCHYSCHAHHRTISHAPDTGDTQCGWWQQSGGTAALATAFPGTTAVPSCQVSRHWPASLGHHTTNCTVYSIHLHRTGSR